MNLEKRISQLENNTGIDLPKFDIAQYYEGEVIRYDGQTFQDENGLKRHCEKQNIHIVPVCIVEPKS